MARARMGAVLGIVGLVVGGLLVAAQFVLPASSWLWDAAYFAGAGASTIIIALAARRMPVSVRSIWWCFTGFVGLWLVADALYVVIDRVAGGVPFPGWPDVAYLASYALALAGLLLLGRRRLPGSDAAAWIDAGILTVAVAATVAVIARVPLVAGMQVFDAGAVLTIAYPLIDLVILATLLRLAVGGGGRNASTALILTAFAVILGADLLYNAEYTLGSSDSLTKAFQALYLTAYLLIAAAASMRSAQDIAIASEGPATVTSARRAVLITLGVLVTPALMLAVVWPDERWLERLLSILTVIVILLALFRIRLLLRIVARQSEALGREARTDPVTGLPNRRTLDYEIERAVRDARATGGALTLAMLDMDHFKAFNDDHGHQAGDELLRSSARAWGRELADGAFLARYGGEEFALLLPGVRASTAERILERVRLATPGGSTVSIGFAELEVGESGFGALHRADQALYAAKSAGRNRVMAAAPATA